MMKYYKRVCRVTISPDLEITDLRIAFEIKKSIESNINTCKVDIYNLSQITRNRITSDPKSLVRVEAGYKENTGLVSIGEGNITNIAHSYKIPDVVTSIYSKDGFNNTKSNLISLSFVDGTLLSDVLDIIIQKLNIPIRYVDYDRQKKIINGFSYVGTIPNVLDKLGSIYGFIWSIQNGQLLILNGLNSTGNQDVFLSAETGLISTPELVIKETYVETLQKNEYNVVSLLQPQLEVGDLVAIESKTINGNFKINELTHIGDTHGETWYTNMIVVNNG
jgi:hypothetical protein